MAPQLSTHNKRQGTTIVAATAPKRVDQPLESVTPANTQVGPNQTTGVARSPRQIAVSRRRYWLHIYRPILLAMDLGAAILAGYASIRLWPGRAQSGFFSEEVLHWIALGIVPITWTLLLWMHGAYEARYLGLGADEFKLVFKAVTTHTALICFLAFTLKAELSRLAVATVLPSTLLLTLLARLLARKVLHQFRRRGRALQRLMLLGTLGETLSVYRITTRNSHAGLQPVGICLTEPTREQSSLPIPVSDASSESHASLIARAEQLHADVIAVCGSRRMDSDSLRRFTWQLEGTGIDLVVAPSLTNIAGPRVHIRPVEGLPLLHVEEPTISGVGWFVKSFLDKALSALSLLVLSPALLIIAVVIKLTSPGTVFFKQERVGRGGEMIRVWKFRTMYTDAEKRLANLLGRNETDGLLFKVRDDPRVTPIGRWMRSLSLDELPQLINVLKGDMSLVGPRPLAVRDQDFLGDVRRRLLVRPGITGLCQVSGRSNLNWENSVRLDLYYVDNWSLMFDAMILWRTFFAVLKRDGAF